MPRISIRRVEFQDEAELALAVCQWLEWQQWDVYKEVPIGRGGECDIVATKDGVVWAIECKMRAGDSVCEQALNRLGYAHYVSVAIPDGRANHTLMKYFLNGHGIGLLEVSPYRFGRFREKAKAVGPEYVTEGYEADMMASVCKEIIRPLVWREKNVRKKLLERIRHTRQFLTEDWKIPIAGAPCGGQMTPWKVTIKRVDEYLRRKGSATINELVKHVEHHYHNDKRAKSGLYRALSDLPIFKGKYSTDTSGKETKWSLVEGWESLRDQERKEMEEVCQSLSL